MPGRANPGRLDNKAVLNVRYRHPYRGGALRSLAPVRCRPSAPYQAACKTDALRESMKHAITLRVNGRFHQDEVDERQLLVYYLRETLGLTGTHVGCVIGECGACSVLVDGELVKSCLQLAVQADGCEVTTIEGLAPPDALSAVQQAFVEEYGLQCGYCTPGMVLAAQALLSDQSEPTEQDVREALGGNICMCTGYVQIVQAVLTAARKLRQAGGQAKGVRSL